MGLSTETSIVSACSNVNPVEIGENPAILIIYPVKVTVNSASLLYNPAELYINPAY
jgi:hypothetical protein